MFTKPFSRRNFLKYSLIGASALLAQGFRPYFGPEDEQVSGNLARVCSETLSVYSEPSDKSKIIYQRKRDEVINVYDQVISDDGPSYNPLWYKVWGGYVHSAYLQRVQIRYNPIEVIIPENGLLSEVTVPLTQTMRKIGEDRWDPVYRLYYESVHWITGIENGPDGKLWYKLKDELLEVEYHVLAEHMRIIPVEELAPISPEIPSHKKRLEVSIAYQTVKAYEYDELVFETQISSGVPNRNPDPNGIPTDTPKGKFNIQSKMPSKHMGNGQLTSDVFAYELPGVPWTCFFEPVTGVAFHGTYWHRNFGLQMSRGCVNMKTEEAKWLFRWATPPSDAETVEKRGFGTEVIVT
jgi:hypothetical protein